MLTLATVLQVSGHPVGTLPRAAAGFSKIGRPMCRQPTENHVDVVSQRLRVRPPRFPPMLLCIPLQKSCMSEGYRSPRPQGG